MHLQAFPDYPAVLPFTLNYSLFRVNKEPQPEPYKLEDLLKTQGSSIKEGKVAFDKPIAVIYNPNSGAKTNIKSRILEALVP